MDRACRLRSFALVRRVRQGGEEVLAHWGVFTRRSRCASEVCSGFHGHCPEFYRPLLFGISSIFTSMTVLFSQHACVVVLTTVRVLSARRRRGLRFGSQTIVRLRVLFSPL